jgi:predicted O-linked N-acetylglucosamine transferase (SPINDLY family)
VGETFASRVAASLLHAAGVPELVTDSPAAYEAAAKKLAHEPKALAAIRARLDHDRLICPLFDTPRYTRNFETALLTIDGLRQSGEPPRSFVIEDGAG